MQCVYKLRKASFIPDHSARFALVFLVQTPRGKSCRVIRRSFSILSQHWEHERKCGLNKLRQNVKFFSVNPFYSASKGCAIPERTLNYADYENWWNFEAIRYQSGFCPQGFRYQRNTCSHDDSVALCIIRLIHASTKVYSNFLISVLVTCCGWSFRTVIASLTSKKRTCIISVTCNIFKCYNFRSPKLYGMESRVFQGETRWDVNELSPMRPGLPATTLKTSGHQAMRTQNNAFVIYHDVCVKYVRQITKFTEQST